LFSLSQSPHPKTTLFPYTTLFRSRYKAHKKAIEKILRNNTQIISKLDTLIAGQKDIESRLSNLEKKLDQNNNDMIDSDGIKVIRSEEHTSELQSLRHLVCRLLLEK